MKLKCRETGRPVEIGNMGAIGFKVLSMQTPQVPRAAYKSGQSVEIEFYSLRAGKSLGRTTWVNPEDIDCEVDHG